MILLPPLLEELVAEEESEVKGVDAIATIDLGFNFKNRIRWTCTSITGLGLSVGCDWDCCLELGVFDFDFFFFFGVLLEALEVASSSSSAASSDFFRFLDVDISGFCFIFLRNRFRAAFDKPSISESWASMLSLGVVLSLAFLTDFATDFGGDCGLASLDVVVGVDSAVLTGEVVEVFASASIDLLRFFFLELLLDAAVAGGGVEMVASGSTSIAPSSSSSSLTEKVSFFFLGDCDVVAGSNSFSSSSFFFLGLWLEAAGVAGNGEESAVVKDSSSASIDLLRFFFFLELLLEDGVAGGGEETTFFSSAACSSSSWTFCNSSTSSEALLAGVGGASDFRCFRALRVAGGEISAAAASATSSCSFLISLPGVVSLAMAIN